MGVWLDLTAANRTLGIEPAARVSKSLAPSTASSLRSAMPEKQFTGSAQDPHGQPLAVSFNRARRAERDLYELLGWRAGYLPTGVSSRARHCSFVIGSDATLMPWSTGPFARFTNAY